MRTPLHDLHASNLLTYCSLGAALAAAAAALEHGSFATAGALLSASALADTFDGRFARGFARSERQRKVGGHLDSLVDAIVFGIVPVVVLSALPHAAGGLADVIWWTAAFVYVLAAVTRLGFYNVEQDETQFVGVPMPAIALIWSTSLLWPPAHWVVPLLSLACATAMVAPIRIRRPTGAAFAGFAIWGLLLVSLHTARLVG